MAEIRPLTGLRGVAAMTVFLAHTRETMGEHGFHLAVPEWFERLFLSGGRQVDIFFVLSGFILSMNYREWFASRIPVRSYLTFLRRRIARIYPLHFVILVLVIGFVVAAHLSGAHINAGIDRFQVHDLPAYFLLVQAWGPFTDNEGYWNPPAWSVSIELLAYLVFPLFIWAVARSGERWIWGWLVLGLTVGFGLNAMTHWGFNGFPGVARGTSEFFLGCLTMELFRTPAARWLQGEAGSVFAAVLLAACYLLEPDTGFIVAVCAAPLLLSLSTSNTVSRFFGWQPVFFLGEISYSIYLGHFLLSSIAYRVVSESWMQTSPLARVAGIAAIIVFVLVASTFLYYFVERPGRNLLSGRRKAA